MVIVPGADIAGYQVSLSAEDQRPSVAVELDGRAGASGATELGAVNQVDWAGGVGREHGAAQVGAPPTGLTVTTGARAATPELPVLTVGATPITDTTPGPASAGPSVSWWLRVRCWSSRARSLSSEARS